MTSVLPTLVRALVTLLAIGGTLGHLAYLDALWWHSLGLTETVARDVSPALVLLLSFHAVVSIVSALFAVALVLHEGPRQSAARYLGAAFGAWSYLMAYSGVTMLLRPDPGPLREVFEAHFLVIEVLGLLGLVRFTALFPTPLIRTEIEAPPTLPSVLLPAHHASLWMLRPWAPWIAGGAVLAVVWGVTVATGHPVSDGGLSRLMDLVRLTAAGLVVLNLRRSWGRADAEGRAKMSWLLVGLACLIGSLSLMIGGNVLVSVAGYPTPQVAWQPLLIDLGLVGFLSGLALSVLHSGPLDPARLALRIATAASFGTFGLFLAAGLEALLAGRALAAFSLRPGVGTVLAAATVVSTYRAFARLVERLVSEG